MRKNPVIVAFLILISVILLGAWWKGNQNSLETFNVNAVSESEIKDELIIAIFVENIRGSVSKYYSEFYSGEIAVYNYEIDILEIQKSNGLISIKFGVTPQIGAHNPLGYDELQYTIDSAGNGKLTNYQHVKDYAIPERFEKYIIF